MEDYAVDSVRRVRKKSFAKALCPAIDVHPGFDLRAIAHPPKIRLARPVRRRPPDAAVFAVRTAFLDDGDVAEVRHRQPVDRVFAVYRDLDVAEDTVPDHSLEQVLQ